MFLIMIMGDDSAVYEKTNCPIKALTMLLKYQTRGYRPLIRDDFNRVVPYSEMKRLAEIATRRAKLRQTD